MIKAYLKKSNTRAWDEVMEISTETGIVHHYFISKENDLDFPFSENKTTVYKMGYKSPDHMIQSLKARKVLGMEVDYHEQRKRNIEGLKRLIEFRMKNNIPHNDVERILATY